MQISRFSKGGFVIHGIVGNFKGRVSAWFDAERSILDAEQIPRSFGSSRPVKPNGPIWQKCKSLGKRYKHHPVA